MPFLQTRSLSAFACVFQLQILFLPPSSRVCLCSKGVFLYRRVCGFFANFVLNRMEMVPELQELSWKDCHFNVFSNDPSDPEIVDSYYEATLAIKYNLREVLLSLSLPSTEFACQNLFSASGLYVINKNKALFKSSCTATCARCKNLRFTHEFLWSKVQS